ncbi:phosphatase 2C-like domain-containing protein [Mycena rebaudengoi]|nr:phosphatase 2C-like domain-containing protein [Mycena rebaudengoi]
MVPPTFNTTEQVLHGIKVYQSALPKKDEDRTVVFAFEHGTIIAIFDGHHSSELSEFASKHLPQLIANRFDPTATDVDRVITEIFEDFDQELMQNVYKLFEEKEDWSRKHWDDPGNVHEVVGYGPNDPQFRDARLAVVGTTVLIGIIDKDKKHVWVISLGDCDAVCGRRQDQKWTPVLLSDRHNCTNSHEVERLLAEHPGEKDVVLYNRVLGTLAVTRALGDHQLKVESRPLARRIMSYLYPSPMANDSFEKWERDNNNSPPYLSSSPAVRRHDLLPGDMLVFTSDGLPDSMYNSIPAADRWDIIISLANGEDHEKLGHACIQPEDGDNVAERVIKNVLFGQDADKRATQLAAALDDISVVVVDLQWSGSGSSPNH